LLQVYLHLRARGRATTAAIARQFNVTKDVARDDLRLLEQVGLLVVVGEGRDREWLVDPLSDTGVRDLYDALALRIGKEHMAFLADTPLHASLERAERGHASSFGRHLARLSQKVVCLHEPARRYDHHEEVIDELIEGLLGERRLAFTYRGAAQGEVEPLTLVIYRRALYLLARVPGLSKVRRYVIDHIADVVRGERFEWPEAWDPQQELRPWFGIYAAGEPEPVVLRFDADRAELVRARDWHPTASLHTLSDGRVELRLCTAGPELVRFILEWGPTVEVISPPRLREEVLRELRGALARYEPEAPA
jgi:predicted DNA-binding transcriptional regulator YafY